MSHRPRISSSAAAAAGAGGVVVVPAVPLSSIWDRFHCDGIVDDDDPPTTSLDKMEKIIIRTSDLSDGEGTRLMRHSQSLIVNKSGIGGGDGDEEKRESLHSLRIATLHDNDEVLVEETTTIALNFDENRVEINLLSFASSPNDCDDDDCQKHPLDDKEDADDVCVIYGGEYYNLASSDTNNSDGVIGSAAASVDVPLAILDIIGAGSYLVSDLFGVPGYEQVLVLPSLVIDDTKSLSNIELWQDDDDGCGGTMNDEKWQHCMELLQVILEHSIVTDGVTILNPVLSSLSQSQVSSNYLAMTKIQGGNSLSTTTTGSSSSSFTIPPLLITLEDERDDQMGDEFQEVHRHRQLSRVRRKKKISIKAVPLENGDASNNERTTFAAMSKTTTRKEIPVETYNSLLTEDEESPPAPWLDAIAQTVEHRLVAELSEVERMESSAQLYLDLVDRGRATVHSALRDATSGDNYDPEVLRLRYGIRPRAASIESSCDGISVVLDLEVDLIMRPSMSNTLSSTSKEDESSYSSSSLHDLHLSCTLANMASSLTDTPKTIRTVSGVVPTLQPGDCVTILASALIADLRLNIMHEESRYQSSMLDICIQGLWTKEDYSISNAVSARHAAVLCILRLPVETLFLVPPRISPLPRSNHWIQYEIDFISNTKSRNRTCSSSSQSCPNIHPFPILPTAIFEYRSPRTLTIDTSFSIQDASIWKDLVSNMNARVGGNTFIDFYWKKGDPRLNLVIFSSNMEERAGEMKYVFTVSPRIDQSLTASQWLSHTEVRSYQPT